MFDIRTDLALEMGEMYREQNPGLTEIDGVKTQILKEELYTVTKVFILNSNGEKALSKKTGSYFTIESDLLLTGDTSAISSVSDCLCRELSGMLGKFSYKTVLVAGLGNREITPDSIGPETVSKLLVTRHIFGEMPTLSDVLAPVCAIAPGVLGITGIETLEILKGVTERVAPDIVIVIDALAARKPERIATTIQICDTGITPGSGVLNSRKEISRETLGIPVIVIGVPMVVDAASIVRDAVENIPEKDLQKVLKTSSLIVTPKDVDSLAKRMSHILANGINLALQPKLSPEDIATLTS